MMNYLVVLSVLIEFVEKFCDYYVGLYKRFDLVFILLLKLRFGIGVVIFFMFCCKNDIILRRVKLIEWKYCLCYVSFECLWGCLV